MDDVMTSNPAPGLTQMPDKIQENDVSEAIDNLMDPTSPKVADYLWLRFQYKSLEEIKSEVLAVIRDGVNSNKLKIIGEVICKLITLPLPRYDRNGKDLHLRQIYGGHLFTNQNCLCQSMVESSSASGSRSKTENAKAPDVLAATGQVTAAEATESCSGTDSQRDESPPLCTGSICSDDVEWLLNVKSVTPAENAENALGNELLRPEGANIDIANMTKVDLLNEADQEAEASISEAINMDKQLAEHALGHQLLRPEGANIDFHGAMTKVDLLSEADQEAEASISEAIKMDKQPPFPCV